MRRPAETADHGAGRAPEKEHLRNVKLIWMMCAFGLSVLVCFIVSVAWFTADDFVGGLDRFIAFVVGMAGFGALLRAVAEVPRRETWRGALDGSGKVLAVTAALFTLWEIYFRNLVTGYGVTLIS